NPDGEITIKFDMTPTLIEANPMVKADSGKAALQLGPVIYCAEGVDNGNILRGKFIDKNLQCRIQYNPEFGLNTITAKGFKKLFSDRLYAPFSEDFEKTEINLIPFSCFANRDECDMMVWLDVR
ncbi:MAG: hypothetical protein PUE13_08705, partial [Clostridiales bacterium]|nr:hypothetical protein [Clostridiales bacterium]